MRSRSIARRGFRRIVRRKIGRCPVHVHARGQDREKFRFHRGMRRRRATVCVYALYLHAIAVLPRRDGRVQVMTARQHGGEMFWFFMRAAGQPDSGECANDACVDQAPSGVNPGLGRSESGDNCFAGKSIGVWVNACCFDDDIPGVCLYNLGEVCRVCAACLQIGLVTRASHKAAQNDLALFTQSRGHVDQSMD
jgi:hypothetical protein